jgi:hypothetical protein
VTVSTRNVALTHHYEFIRLPLLTYQTLRQPESYERQDLGRQEIDEQITDFGARFTNSEIATIGLVVATGKNYYDANGNLLPTSSGATLTVDWGVPAGNQNQLDVLGTGAIIAASWATAGTDIASHLRTLKQQALYQHGYEPTIAIYGKSIPTYFQNNTTLNAYFQRNAVFRDKLVATNEIPQGMLDFDWYPGWKLFYEDSAGTNQKIVADDAVIFMPPVARTWYEFQLGSYLVPRTLDIQSDRQASDFETVYGMFSFGQSVRNPVTADVYMGHTFGPVLKNPKVIYQADVVP